MSKLVRIYNFNKDAYGKPFTICKKHLKELEHRLNSNTIVTEIGTSKNKCEDCHDNQ